MKGSARFRSASGTLTALLYDIALAGKVIASNTTRGGLVGILGKTSDMNVQGEQVMKLDRLADQIMYRLNDHTGRLAVMASEENADPLPIQEGYPTGKYVLLFDPLDGSSNIDVNVAIGTIFSIYRRKSDVGTRDAGGLPATGARPGGGRIHQLQRGDHDGVLQRIRRARLYPR